jgi:YihY family inner membrane protein
LIPPIYLERVRPWWTRIKPTVHYLMETEAHVYALAIAASTLLAFYPFVIVMTAICRDILHWPAAAGAVTLALKDFFAGEQGDFIVRNIAADFGATKLHLTSIFLLLFTSNGVFEPMEVALNRAWGVTENRTYIKNQIVSLGLIFACGGLVLISLMLTALPKEMLPFSGWFAEFMEKVFFKLAAVPISILALFLVYWQLPNRKVDPRRVARVAVVVGLIIEGCKYVNLLVAPLLQRKFREDYGVFRHSVTILVLSFLASLIVLGGAHWTAKHEQVDPLS